MIEINFRLSLFFHIPLYFPDIRPNQFGAFWNNLLFAQIVSFFIVGNNFFVLIVRECMVRDLLFILMLTAVEGYLFMKF